MKQQAGDRLGSEVITKDGFRYLFWNSSFALENDVSMLSKLAVFQGRRFLISFQASR